MQKIEVEYGLYFTGRVARPPLEKRARVEAIITRQG